MTSLGADRYFHIVVLTGAGVSVASGLRTYRGAGGLWTEHPEAERMAQIETFVEDPLEGWRFFAPLRAMAWRAEPNPAHRALATLGARGGVTVITQNVDGLHLRAGSPAVVEYHGSILRTRCANPACSSKPFEDRDGHTEELPHCGRCGEFLRPDVVLFGEAIPADADMAARRALRECDLFLAVGTSGAVYPAAGFVRAARHAGARTVLVNLEPLEEPDDSFQEEYLGRAEEILPVLLS